MLRSLDAATGAAPVHAVTHAGQVQDLMSPGTASEPTQPGHFGRGLVVLVKSRAVRTVLQLPGHSKSHENLPWLYS